MKNKKKWIVICSTIFICCTLFYESVNMQSDGFTRTQNVIYYLNGLLINKIPSGSSSVDISHDWYSFQFICESDTVIAIVKNDLEYKAIVGIGDTLQDINFVMINSKKTDSFNGFITGVLPEDHSDLFKHHFGENYTVDSLSQFYFEFEWDSIHTIKGHHIIAEITYENLDVIPTLWDY